MISNIVDHQQHQSEIRLNIQILVIRIRWILASNHIQSARDIQINRRIGIIMTPKITLDP